MLPLDTYPYAIRVTSEIMESNGSTSMASVCGGTLALMDAGVPSFGRSAESASGFAPNTMTKMHHSLQALDRHHRLGDAFCDMDCKIAGTDRGIQASNWTLSCVACRTRSWPKRWNWRALLACTSG